MGYGFWVLAWIDSHLGVWVDGGSCVGAVTVVLRLPVVFDMICLGWSVLWGLLGCCLCFGLSLDVFGDVVGSNRSPNRLSFWVCQFVFGY